MKLVHYRGAVANFGDELNRYIWPSLAPELFEDDSGVGFCGIGTIVGMPCDGLPELIVFSSGVGNDRLENWRDKSIDYICVRGPLSARLLDLDPDLAVTDGAVLAPLVEGFPKSASGKGRGAVVPHWQTILHGGWDDVAEMTDLELIDPRSAPPAVVRKISEAPFVLTESLHGAILAEVYGVPWAAFATSNNFGIFKWIDWVTTIGQPLTFTVVPPPNVRSLLAFGRRTEPEGTTLNFGPDQARQIFDGRAAKPRSHPMKDAAKSLLKAVPALQSFLGYTPERTAEALARLVPQAAVADDARTTEYQERLSARLTRLRAR